MEAPPVQYTTTPDGFSIAYSVVGAGRPIVFLPLGLNHIQLAWKHDGRINSWLEELASRFRLIQYDTRGEGMSGRGLDVDHTMADYQTDLEAVINRLKLDRVVLLGYFYSGHVAIRYAMEHPDRVEALVLVSTSIAMDDWPIGSLLQMAERNWEAMLYNWVPPTATPEERAGYLSFFKETRTQADWLTSARVFTRSSVAGEIDSLMTPTLVLHPREFLWLPPAESARLAARITNARFSLIDGVLPLGDAKQGVQAIESFLMDVGSGEVVAAPPQGPRPTDLSSRELEVLRLITAGRSNQQIADELVISLNTVARHVSNIFIKIGAANRAEAAAFAVRHDLLNTK
ncbi:MAG TPA: alpha/beta fold hydrolase [Dehalococcoidia bacterium]|nr:alpha/beta fold hydrolase [Dehalococcoidia bacterium]